EALVERVEHLIDRGDDEALRLAAHLAEWLVLARPDSARAHEVRARAYAARVAAERSTMAKGVFGWAVRESARRAAPPRRRSGVGSAPGVARRRVYSREGQEVGRPEAAAGAPQRALRG